MTEVESLALSEGLITIRNNISARKYPCLPTLQSKLVRTYFKSQLNLPLLGNQGTVFKNKLGTVLATGYRRVVIGDYGAYVEFAPENIAIQNIHDKWPGKPRRPVKYIWMESNDPAKTKIYKQMGKVEYADYIPGMYYIAPEDLTW